MTITREKKGFYNSRLSQGDAFYRLFLGDVCLGKACYDKCKFKLCHSSADIRIGDLWGTTYQHDEKGVSGVIVFTEKGYEVLKKCHLKLTEQPVSVVTEGQMQSNPKKPFLRELILLLLKSPVSLSVIVFVYRVHRFTERHLILKSK